LYDKTAGDKWARVGLNNAACLSCAYDHLHVAITRQIAAKQHFQLLDFDDHLDDVTRRVSAPWEGLALWSECFLQHVVAHSRDASNRVSAHDREAAVCSDWRNIGFQLI
jgi:hypothetical protein